MISFSGEIGLTTAEAVSSALQPWVEAGGPVTVDLSEVTLMDSNGVHALTKAAEGLACRGCIIIHGAHCAIQQGPRAHLLDSVTNIHVIGYMVLVDAA